MVFGIAVAGAGFFGFAPSIIENSMNKIDGKPLIAVSEQAKALHQTLTIVDLHSDSLMWDRDINDRANRGHMDMQRLAQGNVALQVFSSVSKTPKGQNYDANGADSDNITLLTMIQMQPLRTWGSLLERSLWHATKLVRAFSSDLRPVDSSSRLYGLLAVRSKVRRDVLSATYPPGEKPNPLPIGAMLSIEGWPHAFL
jgi:hypothetical protein